MIETQLLKLCYDLLIYMRQPHISDNTLIPSLKGQSFISYVSIRNTKYPNADIINNNNHNNNKYYHININNCNYNTNHNQNHNHYHNHIHNNYNSNSYSNHNIINNINNNR